MSDIDAIISDHFDRDLDEREMRALDAWLAASRANQRLYVNRVLAHRALLNLGGAASEARPSRRLPRRRPRVRPAAATWQRVAAIAALVLVALIGAWWHRRAPSATPTPVVASREADDAPVLVDAVAAEVRAPDGSAAAAGAPLAAGATIELRADGAATLRYADGTTLRCGAATRVAIAAGAGKRLEVRQGTVSAEVSPQRPGRPLVIAGAGAEVEVVGTSLTVAVADGETRTDVAHGRVVVRRLADGASCTVDARQFAIAAPGTPLRARQVGEASGRLLAVGVGRAYARLDQLPPLEAGDVVELHAGTHVGPLRIRASGTALRPIAVRAAGDGEAIVDGRGLALDGAGDTPRALLQLDGSHYVVEGVRFADAAGSPQTSAIWARGSRDLTLRGCRFVRCNRAVVGDDVDLVMERCVIADCGDARLRGNANAVQISGPSAVITRCDIQRIASGAALDASSRRLVVSGCRIGPAEDGEVIVYGSARDGSDGAEALAAFTGNLIATAPRPRDANQWRLIDACGPPGPRGGLLALSNNTFVAADANIVFVRSVGSPVRVVADADIFVGSDRIAELDPAGSISGRADWLPRTAAAPPGLVDTLPRSDDPGFVDAAGGDYRLSPRSPCVGAAPSDLRWFDRGVDGRQAEACTAPGSDAATPPSGGRRSVGAFAPSR